MGKNAYLIIPDLHMGDINSANRINYRAEIEAVQREMAKIAVKYKKAGYNTITLFMGDIFHHSYTSIFPAIVDHDFIFMWRQKVGECFTVLGNHELTYYQANPFYTLIHNIESQRLQNVTNHSWQPLGPDNVVRVPDILQDGEVTFYFNHYGTGIQRPGDGVSIGLFHQEIADKQILDDVVSMFGSNPYAKTQDVEQSGILDDYDYCFFGHFHLLYGKWKMKNSVLHYLGSLGRTNVLEVQDNFLERCIPVVLVDEGKLVSIDENYFNLMTRAECILESVAEVQHEKYLQSKEFKQLRTYTPLGDDPIKNLYCKFAEEPRICKLLDDLSVLETDSRMLSLYGRMQSQGVRVEY